MPVFFPIPVCTSEEKTVVFPDSKEQMAGKDILIVILDDPA